MMPEPLNLPALKARIAAEAETAGTWTSNLTYASTDLPQCVEVIEALCAALEEIAKGRRAHDYPENIARAALERVTR